MGLGIKDTLLAPALATRRLGETLDVRQPFVRADSTAN